MATREEYEQVTAFARIDGALLGVIWIVSFACFIGEFKSPLLGTLGLAIGAFSIVFAALRLRRFRNRILDGAISFRRAFGYSIFTYFYAALIMAAGQFVYFQFIDQGYLIGQYTETMSTPEFGSLLKLYGISKSDVDAALETMSSLRPIDIALQFFTTNIIIGLIVSLPVAAMFKSNRKTTK